MYRSFRTAFIFQPLDALNPRVASQTDVLRIRRMFSTISATLPIVVIVSLLISPIEYRDRVTQLDYNAERKSGLATVAGSRE